MKSRRLPALCLFSSLAITAICTAPLLRAQDAPITPPDATPAPAFAPVANAADAALGEIAQTLLVPAKVDEAGVRRAVVNAALARDWTVVSAKDNPIVLKRVKSGYEANFFVKLSATEIQIFSDSYVINRKGERQKRLTPASWVKALVKDLQAKLNTESLTAH